MKDNKNGLFKGILCIIGGVVVLAGAVIALVHFWEDIKKCLPCCKCGDEELPQAEDEEAPAEEAAAEAADFAD